MVLYIKFYVIGDKNDMYDFFGGTRTLVEAKAVAEKHAWEDASGERHYPKVYAARDCKDIGTPDQPFYIPFSNDILPAAEYKASIEEWCEPHAVVLIRGTYTMGMIERHNDGTAESNPPNFRIHDGGGSVAVGVVNLATMDQAKPLDLFGDFDAAGFLGKAYQELYGLASLRKPNIPDLKAVFTSVGKNSRSDCPLMDWCNKRCQDCIFHQWMEEGAEDNDAIR